MSLVEANGRDKSSATWRLLPGQQVFMGCRVSELKEHVAQGAYFERRGLVAVKIRSPLPNQDKNRKLLQANYKRRQWSAQSR